MSDLLRREAPLAVASVILIVLFIEFYVKNALISTIVTQIQEGAIIISAAAVGVGVISLFSYTFRKISRKAHFWMYDIWMLVIFGVTTVAGLIGTTYGAHTSFQWLMTYIFLPLDSSIYSMVMFDIVHAFYRSFRVKSTESAILFVSAVIIMIGQAPVTGGVLPQFLPISSWLFNIPTAGVSRGLTIVTAIGLLCFAIRLLLMREKTTLGVST